MNDPNALHPSPGLKLLELAMPSPSILGGLFFEGGGHPK